MPPDRTTPSFSTARSSGLPLSSHGPDYIPSLRRGGACKTCKTRKTRCDGLKPSCTPCSKSALAHGEDPSFLICNYEKTARRSAGQAPPPPTPVSTPEANRIAGLERENAELRRALHDASIRPSLDLQALLNTTQQQQPWDPNSLFINNFMTSSQPLPHCVPETPPSDLLYELFYPGWPSDLCSPALVSRLVDIYFTRAHPASGMINSSFFRSTLRLPPTHYYFPHPALIHAVLAFASRLVSEEFFSLEGQYWIGADSPQPLTPSEYHIERAQAAIQEAMTVRPEKLYSLFQAIVLVSMDSYISAKFLSVWSYSGLAMRSATPLGLNHIRNGHPCHPSTPPIPITLEMEDLGDESILRERALMFWFAVSLDKLACASTGWAASLVDEDNTSLLPAPKLSGTPVDLASSPLSMHSPDFFTSHPPSLVQPMQLYFKSVVLMGNVVTFLQRLPPPIGLGLTGKSGSDASTIRSKVGHLHADCIAFRSSIPHGHQLSSAPGSDFSASYMVLVDAVSHTASILLHEPFCSTASSDFSLLECFSSARAVLAGIHRLLNTSFEIPSLAPAITFCWAVCGRTLVRELAMKCIGDPTSVGAVAADVRTVINAMRAYKSALGDSTATALAGLLRNPETCLPSSDIRHATGVGFSEGKDVLFKFKFTAMAEANGESSTPPEPDPGALEFSTSPTLGSGFVGLTDLGELENSL